MMCKGNALDGTHLEGNALDGTLEDLEGNALGGTHLEGNALDGTLKDLEGNAHHGTSRQDAPVRWPAEVQTPHTWHLRNGIWCQADPLGKLFAARAIFKK